VARWAQVELRDAVRIEARDQAWGGRIPGVRHPGVNLGWFIYRVADERDGRAGLRGRHRQSAGIHALQDAVHLAGIGHDVEQDVALPLLRDGQDVVPRPAVLEDVVVEAARHFADLAGGAVTRHEPPAVRLEAGGLDHHPPLHGAAGEGEGVRVLLLERARVARGAHAHDQLVLDDAAGEVATDQKGQPAEHLLFADRDVTDELADALGQPLVKGHASS